MREPAVRARGVQAAIKWADSFGDEPGRVSALIDPRVHEHIMSATPTSWIPVELDRFLSQAIVDAHGETGAASCWRQFMGHYARSPALKGFVATSKRLFGLTPGAVVKAVGKGWTHSYRDFAEVRGELDDHHHGIVHFEQVHSSVFGHEPYAICFRSLIQGACDIVGEADVQMKRDPEARGWQVHVRW